MHHSACRNTKTFSSNYEAFASELVFRISLLIIENKWGVDEQMMKFLTCCRHHNISRLSSNAADANVLELLGSMSVSSLLIVCGS